MKRYERPTIVYRERIEVRAGTCGKAGAPGCGAGPYVS